jgi:hypothetical protein
MVGSNHGAFEPKLVVEDVDYPRRSYSAAYYGGLGERQVDLAASSIHALKYVVKPGWISQDLDIYNDAIDWALRIIYLCEVDRPLDLLKVLDLTC